MLGLFGVDTFTITEANIEVNNWWIAALISGLAAGAVYGKAKLDETKPPGDRM